MAERLFKLCTLIWKKHRWELFCIITLALLIYAYFQVSWIALGFALFIFFEVLMSWCLFFQILGKNSCPIKKKK